tara:strand:- start:5685 stop:6947 length:1263 start_codon:yes stop_codon:yes gene_type:complete
MSFYIQALFIAIPIFSLFIVIEWIIASKMKLDINRPADFISSLSSGMSNITKDGMKLSVVLISYSLLVDNFTIYKLEPLWLAAGLAFLVQDFSGYWMHRLNHRVNIFWNRHVIHHSSEEFNLAAGLRQSISETFHFSALLMIPAALLGVPSEIFAVLAPLHLFMQFWYHTRLIKKMGWLEKIIVTPSHHRVHHAINPEYIDKNYGQILIIWDKLFGSFQKELDHVKPVYGTLRPAKTWNPILINFKHIWQLFKDAYHTKGIWDKVRIWFMPTGWRPQDVELNYPLKTIHNPNEQQKYHTKLSSYFITWSFIQKFIGLLFMFHFFSILHLQNSILNYSYGLFILTHIFSFTAAMDQKKYSINAEIIKVFFVLGILVSQNISWFGLDGLYVYCLLIYIITSYCLTRFFYKNETDSGKFLQYL